MFQFDHVRTRFAPSPTGYMHVGNLRTALFAYLVAKSNNGRFLLRIEDTDQERQVEGAVEIIYKTLKETGLLWDEGPDIGGPVGPYIQSQRMDMFKAYAEKLVESGHAYYCFCDKERLEEVRKVQEASGMAPRYDGHCRNLSKEEVAEKLAAGVPYVIRQKVPTEGTVTFHDEVYGDVTVDCSTLDDQILIKGDGMPTYNFANVVDDHTMGITHVIRGNEYLSSTPKYNLLYEAFGWEIPKYIHCAPVMRDATHKLSKRHGDASYEDLVQMGFLTPAILNYIALLGWSPKGDREFRAGAAKALAIAKENGVELAILQSRSPSCGVKKIYDGTFSGTKIPGQGVFAKMLMDEGIRVLDAGELPKTILKNEDGKCQSD